MIRYRYLPILFYLVFFQVSYSQDTLLFVGGLNRYSKLPPQEIENANLRVWYQFSYPVLKDNELARMQDTMTLVVGNNFSVYYDWNRELKYSKMIGQLDAVKKKTTSIHYTSFNSFIQEAIHDDRLSTFSLNRENAEILKDRKRHVMVTTDMDDADIRNVKYYLLEEKISPQEWQVYDDTMEIMGYICQRALCSFRGRDYTAWFTMEIPLNDGPYKFYGLPGLILSVEDSEKQFQFRAFGIEQLAGVVIVSDNKNSFIESTTEQYKKIKKRMQETVVMYYSKGSTLFMAKRTIPLEYISLELQND